MLLGHLGLINAPFLPTLAKTHHHPFAYAAKDVSYQPLAVESVNAYLQRHVKAHLLACGRFCKKSLFADLGASSLGREKQAYSWPHELVKICKLRLATILRHDACQEEAGLDRIAKGWYISAYVDNNGPLSARGNHPCTQYKPAVNGRELARQPN